MGSCTGAPKNIILANAKKHGKNEKKYYLGKENRQGSCRDLNPGASVC